MENENRLSLGLPPYFDVTDRTEEEKQQFINGLAPFTPTMVWGLAIVMVVIGFVCFSLS